jgi:hypothetical protein
MNVPRCLSLLACFAVLAASAAPAAADAAADRAAISGSVTRLASGATSLAGAAKGSDDRAARKRFAPAAGELADDLGALARRLEKDAPLRSLAGDAAAIETDAAALIELADEVEDRDERKSLRTQAGLLHQGIGGIRKLIAEAEKKEKDSGPAPAAQRATGRLVNDSDADACSFGENVRFVVTRNGDQVFASQLVFPGRDQALVLDHGRYYVQVVDTVGKQLAARDLLVKRDGWSFATGCVSAD